MAKSGGIFDSHCLKLHTELMCHHIMAPFSLSFCNGSIIKVLNTLDPYWATIIRGIVFLGMILSWEFWIPSLVTEPVK